MSLFYYATGKVRIRAIARLRESSLPPERMSPSGQPFVLLSTSPAWNPLCGKGDDGTLQAPAVRITLKSDVPAVDWDAWAPLSGISSAAAEKIQATLAAHGSDKSELRFCWEQVPEWRWDSVDSWNGEKWSPISRSIFRDDFLLPPRVADLGREINAYRGVGGFRVHAAYNQLVEWYRQRDKQLQERTSEALGDLSLQFAELSHDLVATRNERDQAQQVLQSMPPGRFIPQEDAHRFADAIEAGNQWVMDELVSVLRGE